MSAGGGGGKSRGRLLVMDKALDDDGADGWIKLNAHSHAPHPRAEYLRSEDAFCREQRQANVGIH